MENNTTPTEKKILGSIRELISGTNKQKLIDLLDNITAHIRSTPEPTDSSTKLFQHRPPKYPK